MTNRGTIYKVMMNRSLLWIVAGCLGTDGHGNTQWMSVSDEYQTREQAQKQMEHQIRADFAAACELRRANLSSANG
jgi:hypothetical protein